MRNYYAFIVGFFVAFLVSLFFSSCAPFSRYNYDVRGGLKAEELDAATDKLTQTLDAAGLVKASTARALIAEHFYVVRGVVGPLPCNNVAGCIDVHKSVAAGMLDDRVITLWAEPGRCIGDTAFNHELVHGLLMDILPPNVETGGQLVADGDMDHTEKPVWWETQADADRSLRSGERCR